MSTAVISSDSHFVEPPDLWQKRLDKKFRDRAPKVVRGLNGKKGDFIVAEGVEPIPIAIFLGAGVKPEVYAQLIEQGYDACPKSVWEPGERVKDQDQDGVIAEVIYGSVGLRLFAMTDDELRFACCRAFNDWALEYCSENPKRLIPLGMLSLEDIPAAVAELKRVAAKGMRGVMIHSEADEARPYSSPEYDPVWAAAQDLNVKLSLHVFTARREQKILDGPGGVLIFSATSHQPAERSIAALVLSGVLDRFPKLTIVSAENDLGWMPYLMAKMDRKYLLNKSRFGGATLSLKPSEYILRQVFSTFINEHVSPETLQAYALSNAMWASDYPHTSSTWPNSQNHIQSSFGSLAEADRRKLVHDNVARVYGIDL